MGSEWIHLESVSENLAAYRFFLCANPECGVRFPLDLEVHRGAFCPRCGAPISQIPQPEADPDSLAIEDHPTRRLFALLDNIRSAYNVGAMFRTADGVGIRHLYLCGLTPTPEERPAIRKTALGAELASPWSRHLNALTLAAELKEEGCMLVGLECTAKATPIYRFRSEPPDDRPMVLVVGNERAGVDPGLLDLCDKILALPMTGKKESLNVAVAFGIAAYWLTYI